MSQLGIKDGTLLFFDGKLVYQNDPCECCCCLGTRRTRNFTVSGMPDKVTFKRTASGTLDNSTIECWAASRPQIPADIQFREITAEITGLSALNGTFSDVFEENDCVVASQPARQITVNTYYSGERVAALGGTLEEYTGTAIAAVAHGQFNNPERGQLSIGHTFEPFPGWTGAGGAGPADNPSRVADDIGTAIRNDLPFCFEGTIVLPVLVDRVQTNGNPCSQIVSTDTTVDVTITTTLSA